MKNLKEIIEKKDRKSAIEFLTALPEEMTNLYGIEPTIDAEDSRESVTEIETCDSIGTGRYIKIRHEAATCPVERYTEERGIYLTGKCSVWGYHLLETYKGKIFWNAMTDIKNWIDIHVKN